MVIATSIVIFSTGCALSCRYFLDRCSPGPSTTQARLTWEEGSVVSVLVAPAEIYGWLTEGFDTADLQEAKALLEELS